MCVEGGVTACVCVGGNCVCVCGGGGERCVVVDTCNVSFINNPDLGWRWVGLCRLHVHVTIIAHRKV